MTTTKNNYEIQVEVNDKALKERYLQLQQSTESQIIPVIKNNCNGLDMNHMLDLYKSIGVMMVAASYANEFYLKAKNDDIGKLAWTWTPDPKYKEVKGLQLCCKNFEQLDFCISNEIPYHIVFNLCMNRGGFRDEDIPALREVKGISDSVIIAMHCPYEDQEHIDWYVGRVHEIKEKMEAAGFTVEKIHAANGELFSTDPKTHFDMCRIGSLLFLPKRDLPVDDFNPIIISSYVNSPVMHLKKGENIGYNKFTLDEDTDVVIVPIGYYNFERINKVMVYDDYGNKHLCNVLNMMHDTCVVDISEIKEPVSVRNKVVVLDKDLVQDNWNDCITRTFKLNRDTVHYEYLD